MGIYINGLSIYHPNTQINNTYYINKFGNKIENLLKHLGREERYVIKNDSENSLTMAIEAANSCLKKTNTRPEEIDIIVFVSDSFEYLIPTNALLIREKIKATNCNLTYDINDNCIGLITAIDTISTYMNCKNTYKNALIIGSVYNSLLAKSDCALVNSTAGDGAAAMLLTKSESSGGVLNSAYHTDSHSSKYMVFPECGLSNMFNENLETNKKKYLWINHDVSYFSDQWAKLILKLLNDGNENLNNISHFFFSQFSHPDIVSTLSKLGVENPNDKYTFIADKYGYTGCTSPFFALHYAIENKKVKKGDLIVFCSVGAGYTMGAFLYKI